MFMAKPTCVSCGAEVDDPVTFTIGGRERHYHARCAPAKAPKAPANPVPVLTDRQQDVLNDFTALSDAELVEREAHERRKIRDADVNGDRARTKEHRGRLSAVTHEMKRRRRACAHCQKPIEGPPAIVQTPGKPDVYYHPRHLKYRFTPPTSP
jgi:NMD protein affecting ribosome stability and mRNA decay